MFCAAVLAVLVIVLAYYFVTRTHTDQYVIKGMVVNVISDFDNKEDAMRLVMECNRRMLLLLAYLRRKYKIGATDSECARDCMQWMRAHAEGREVVRHLLRDFNYEVIYEFQPAPGAKSVAYSLDKGRKIMLCLREQANPRNIVDIDTLMFVVLHEAAHIANYEEWGHEEKFWSIFKYLLEEAAQLGVYAPVDYARAPKNYCGFHLNHNPLFDARIESFAKYMAN